MLTAARVLQLWQEMFETRTGINDGCLCLEGFTFPSETEMIAKLTFFYEPENHHLVVEDGDEQRVVPLNLEQLMMLFDYLIERSDYGVVAAGTANGTKIAFSIRVEAPGAVHLVPPAPTLSERDNPLPDALLFLQIALLDLIEMDTSA